MVVKTQQKAEWYRVMRGRALFYPDWIPNQNEMNVWAREGQCVDLSRPYLKALAKDQMHRLTKIARPLKRDKVITNLHPGIARAMAKAEGEVDVGQAAKAAEDLPGIDDESAA